MTTTALIFGALLVAALAWAWSFYNDPNRRTRRAIHGLGVSTIAELPEDQDVRISGVVQAIPDAPLVRTPVHDRECMGWSLHVEQGAVREGGGHKWTNVIRTSNVTDFVVVDKTGEAHVSAGSVELALRSIPWVRMDANEGLDPKLAELLALHEIATETTWAQDVPFRYSEVYFGVGDTVTVMGSGKWDSEQTGAYRSPKRRFRLGPASKGRVLISQEDSR